MQWIYIYNKFVTNWSHKAQSLNIYISKRFISSVELTKVMSDLGERLSEEEVTTSCRCLGWWWWCWSWWWWCRRWQWWCWSWWWWWCRCWRWWCWSWWLFWWLLFADFGLCGHYLYKAGADKEGNLKEQLIRLLNGPNWSIMVWEAGCKKRVDIGGKGCNIHCHKHLSGFFHVSPQTASPRRGKVTLVAFFFSTLCVKRVGIGGKVAISTATNICLGSIIPPTDIKLRKKTLFGNLSILIGGLVELSWIKVEKTYWFKSWEDSLN